MQELEGDLQAVSLELDAMRSSAAQTEGDLQAISLELDAMRSSAAQMEGDLQAVSLELDATRSSAAQMEGDLQAVSLELDAMRSSAAQTEGDLQAISLELDAMRSSATQMQEMKMEEVMHLQGELSQWQQHSTLLQKQLAEQEESHQGELICVADAYTQLQSANESLTLAYQQLQLAAAEELQRSESSGQVKLYMMETCLHGMLACLGLRIKLPVDLPLGWQLSVTAESDLLRSIVPEVRGNMIWGSQAHV